MLKSCSKCGRVHEHNYNCKAITRKKSDTIANKFRNTKIWRDKRNKIVIRDKGLCQLCIRNLYDTYGRIYNNSIEVHHIEPIIQDYELRLDEGNLISLCTYHHKMADRGQISKEELRSIVN